MKFRIDRRVAASICTTALLTSCSSSQPPIGVPGAMPQTPAWTERADGTKYRILYRFMGGNMGGTDGANPMAGLIDVGGKLYGTTFAGGVSCNFYHYSTGCGTVFSVTLKGTEKVLYPFGSQTGFNPNDGFNPAAGLIDVGGTLYGTTQYGGLPGAFSCYDTGSSGEFLCGTIFSVTRRGNENVLYSFRGGYFSSIDDGARPVAPLTYVKGAFYGTTSQGGIHEAGTVFTVTQAGAERVIHSFSSASADGADPQAGLLEVGGKLYGTTLEGGKYRAGTVFTITPNGKERVLHSFGNSTDGANPIAGLIDVGGKLYGTTSRGGRHATGTLFTITASGTEKVLYAFEGASDGAYPKAGLIDVNNTLYGTTSSGGKHGAGTVFSASRSGTERVLHSFGHGADGRSPVAALTDVNGTLYGTTVSGGSAYCDNAGCGVIFAITP